MARFKRIRRRMSRAFGRTGRRTSRGNKSSFTDWLIAGAVYDGVVRPMAKNMLPGFFTFGPVESDDVILAAGGYLIHRKGGIIGALGKYAMARETGNVAAKLIGGSAGVSGTTIMQANNY